MSKLNHTPLPWHIGFDGSGGIRIVGDYGARLVGHASPCRTDVEQKDNAEFIVRACNTHYEMVEVLTQCHLLMKQMFSNRHDDINSLTDRILVVLEKASGQ